MLVDLMSIGSRPDGARRPSDGVRLVNAKRPGMELVVAAQKSAALLGLVGRPEDMHAILDAETDATSRTSRWHPPRRHVYDRAGQVRQLFLDCTRDNGTSGIPAVALRAARSELPVVPCQAEPNLPNRSRSSDSGITSFSTLRLEWWV
jgi:hypothetical protein